jgi:hypothetical protein
MHRCPFILRYLVSLRPNSTKLIQDISRNTLFYLCPIFVHISSGIDSLGISLCQTSFFARKTQASKRTWHKVSISSDCVRKSEYIFLGISWLYFRICASIDWPLRTCHGGMEFEANCRFVGGWHKTTLTRNILASQKFDWREFFSLKMTPHVYTRIS